MVEGIHRKLGEAKGCISELEDRVEKITQRIKKEKDNLRELRVRNPRNMQ